MTAIGSRSKRAIDILVAAVGLIAASPVMGTTAILVRVRMGRPVIFRQARPGLNGVPFDVLKFRTMSETVDENGVLLPASERMTPLGRFLRRWSLDELPQLWNVLIGDMSLVGPRPLLLDYLDLYTPEQARRQSVRPGLTGLAQLAGRQNLRFSERISLDLTYIDTWTLQKDFRILATTLRRLVQPAADENPNLSQGRINDLLDNPREQEGEVS